VITHFLTNILLKNAAAELNFGSKFQSMSRTLLLLLILSAAGQISAQTMNCRIVSARNGSPIPNVAISALQSDAVWITDSMGIAHIDAADPGPFRISHIAHMMRILRPDSASSSWVVALQPLPYSLDGVEVISPVARFRRDSALNHSFFRRELADAHFRPGVKLVPIRTWRGLELGLEWQGVFTNLALIASGKKARYKRFSRELKRMEAGKFTAIRYTTSLVGEQTGLEEDAAMAFIAAHPIGEEFLRAASELELKMLIRDMYRPKR